MNPFIASLLYASSILLIIIVHFIPPHIAQKTQENVQKQLKTQFNELYDTGAMNTHTGYYLKLKKVVRYSHLLHEHDVRTLFAYSEMNDMRIDAILNSLEFEKGNVFTFYLPPLFNFGIWFPLLCPILINMVVVLKTFIRRCKCVRK
ncbi:hypothetical protein THOM_0543 [Trachipleistophora hominis]|uniref:Uncharacterized protein n=1 Tax=Trachipleistophora hominis TaxID=72359 RepID=L7JYW7_TRAHO|nr:hypothetical protein THOM_0543 [Trachipleistophora hominis]